MSTLRRRRQGDDNPPALQEEDSEDSAERFLDVGVKDDDEETRLGEYKDPLIAEPDVHTVKPKKQSRLDSFLSGYVQFTSSAVHQDRGLKLLQWTLWLASLKSKSKNESSLRKLYTHFSFVRYALRLYGLPASLEAAKSGSWGGEGYRYKDGRIGVLGKIMAWSMVVYYPLEHAAYIQWMAPGISKSKSAAKLSAYSCQAWLVYIVAEVVQSALKLKEMHQQRKQLLDKKQDDEGNENTVSRTKHDDSVTNYATVT